MSRISRFLKIGSRSNTHLAIGAGSLLATLLIWPFLADATGADSKPPAVNERSHVLVERIWQKWDGDLPDIRKERRAVRVLVSYNKTNFFYDRGHPRGLEYELLSTYERFLNRHLPRGAIETKVVFIVVPFDRLLPALQEGYGDIAAAGLTITEDRKNKVAFSDPYLKNVKGIVVTSRDVPRLQSIEDLSGQTVHLVSGSNYVFHLRKINAQLIEQGRAPIIIVQVDENLEAEDVLEMVNSGIYPRTVVGDHVFRLWAAVLPDLVSHDHVVVNDDGAIGWAIRRGSSKLLDSLNEFVAENRKGTLVGNILFKRYFNTTAWICNPISMPDGENLERYRPLFEKFASQYGFDWLKIVAVAYQESLLNPTVVSPAGAQGLMQIMPRTAAGRAVGIADVKTVENNIHAGVKYLAYLRDRYFNDPAIDDAARIDFTLAAYNAGPSMILSLRRQARVRGFDPNKWFLNVEYLAREVIGQETVEYVANINKYFIAYQSALKVREVRNEIREDSGVSGGPLPGCKP